ncbi:1-deoxy-D-xylulose-5-phosphate synthase [Caproicibacterium amylolyticum]|uniref:1-deoxy-D-xylulose-5-phosphate synthase n=1 Tax=Caproicibacterium amylolyticum TaxID=2766537 RepID=A0A7G9WJ65_9FIRM|nr:1-deoxy-D-xylulose-5-phosphate synthase [Caproicibacterium amylolyticum]QNO18727.1 1-deoxy-D-xylulose-5-phosphate synthase [Caproicibacterium amylolyticum]
MSTLLDRIHSPADLKDLTPEQLEQLCKEIRSYIIRTVAQNGGHLASNLGTVELTVALHRVFGTPDDKIIWDVGHQAYTHKILTGRKDEFPTIRMQGGLSGFPNRQESEWDAFTAGHSSTSISAALGIAQARALKGKPGHVIAVIGDGALTGGMAYEGLNNAGRFGKNLIVILNDNKMSISRNVGAMARYLAHMRAKPGYLKVKSNVETVMNRIPLIGKPLWKAAHALKAVLRSLLYNSTLFEDMGFYYYGPFDGHDLPQLMQVLETAETIDHPLLIHVVTEKGKGYSFAEQNPGAFHGVSSFDVQTGKASAKKKENFSSVFGSALCSLAEDDNRICAITAAMKTGTGLEKFSERFPQRFFDTGIAEEHAVTFAGGLASQGMLPIFAVYSTFLQRGYDQLIHDVAIQRVKVVFGVDRAGIVGEDGETHQGVFDAAYFNTIPSVTVYSPCYFDELIKDLHRAFYETPGMVAVRYPRGGEPFRPADFLHSGDGWDCYGAQDAPVAIVTYGRLFAQACSAQRELKKQGIPVKIIKLDRIKPLPQDAVRAAACMKALFFFEEGMQQGGVGEHFESLLYETTDFHGQCRVHGIKNFVAHATIAQCLAELKLDADGMVQTITTEWEK